MKLMFKYGVLAMLKNEYFREESATMKHVDYSFYWQQAPAGAKQATYAKALHGLCFSKRIIIYEA